MPRFSRWWLPVLAAGLLPLGGVLAGCQAQRQPPAATAVAPRRVSALGRIEPETKIRKVAISNSLSGDRVQSLLVEENQLVKLGQPLAILNSQGTLKASLDEAEGQVAIARSKLDQVRAGAKQGEIDAQRFTIESLQRKLSGEKLAQDQNVASKLAKLNEASIEAKRYDQLFSAGGSSELERDRYRTRATTSRAEYQQALETREGTLSTLRSQIASEQQTLAKITEVRGVDVVAAESELKKAMASRDRAKQELSYATVVAPQNGQILKINARPGDKVGDDGLLEMADTSRMVVVAEVYQTDMRDIRIGQKATISADGFKGSVQANVYQINSQVQRQSVFSGEPGENQDQRVFEVKLRIESTPAIADRIRHASNLQVNVIFDPSDQQAAKP
ncbi:hemolysin D [Cyanobium sp.]|nr:hemolysin D [Cyanobium sp.]